jgi:hypothetical protein
MVILAACLLFAWLAFDALGAAQRYRQGYTYPISLGLFGLGAVNCVAGFMVIFAETGLSPLVIGSGLLSTNLSLILDDVASKDEITLERYAFRAGLFVFVVGLFVLIEQG